jgi:hypothetical protein
MKLQRRQPFNRTLFIGMMLMAVANVVKLLLERHSFMPEGLRDGLFGLLFGLAIGCVLLGIWRMKHPGATSDKQGCA